MQIRILFVESGDIMYILYIKKYRQLRRMTQQQLADKIGVTQQYIAMIEADNIIRSRSPRLSTLLNISIALNICPKDMLFYSCISCEIEKVCNKKDKVNYEDVANDNLEFYI